MNAQEIIDIIPTGHENAITRKRLHAITGLPDRTIREAISRGNEVVINPQDGKGYFKPDPVDESERIRKADEQDRGDLPDAPADKLHRNKGTVKGCYCGRNGVTVVFDRLLCGGRKKRKKR